MYIIDDITFPLLLKIDISDSMAQTKYLIEKDEIEKDEIIPICIIGIPECYANANAKRLAYATTSFYDFMDGEVVYLVSGLGDNILWAKQIDDFLPQELASILIDDIESLDIL